MTHLSHPELLNTVLQLLNDEGSGGFAEGIRLLVNEAMCQERSQALQAQPDERTDARLGHANGFKPKTLLTRSGPIQCQVPQVRGDLSFHPSALQKGIRSEQALKLALAEMYVQGVSTRKVSAIVAKSSLPLTALNHAMDFNPLHGLIECLPSGLDARQNDGGSLNCLR